MRVLDRNYHLYTHIHKYISPLCYVCKCHKVCMSGYVLGCLYGYLSGCLGGVVQVLLIHLWKTLGVKIPSKPHTNTHIGCLITLTWCDHTLYNTTASIYCIQSYCPWVILTNKYLSLLLLLQPPGDYVLGCVYLSVNPTSCKYVETKTSQV